MDHRLDSIGPKGAEKLSKKGIKTFAELKQLVLVEGHEGLMTADQRIWLSHLEVCNRCSTCLRLADLLWSRTSIS